jgi:hypothetical protein
MEEQQDQQAKKKPLALLKSRFHFTSLYSKTHTKTASSSASDAALACRSAASRGVAAATCVVCPSLCSLSPRAWWVWAACWLLRRSGGRGLGCVSVVRLRE